jgi:NAD(P)H-hydrate epimerase
MKTIYQNKLLYPEILWERPVHYYKSQAGRILVIAGSRGMQGAALLACESIFRSGTGILTLAFPEELKNAYTGILPEAMTLALPQTHSGSLSRKAKSLIVEQLRAVDLVLIGPGLSTNTETVQLIWELLTEMRKPLVLDADGLKALAYGIDAIRGKEGIEKVQEYFKNIKSKIIITPHPGETAHIMEALGAEKNKCKTNYIEHHKEEVASYIYDNIGTLVILKGNGTIIYNGKSVVIDKIGGPELATAGSGDVLSGIVASFVSQNPTKYLKASATAVYLHSLAGKLAKEELGERSVMAGDIIRFLPQAIKKAEE